MDYQLSEPVNVIFLAVENLKELAELTGRPFTLHQIVNTGYLLVSKHSIFRSDIRKWFRKAAVSQTWLEFNTFFIEVHQEIRDTDTLFSKLSYHSVNAIVKQIFDQL